MAGCPHTRARGARAAAALHPLYELRALLVLQLADPALLPFPVCTGCGAAVRRVLCCVECVYFGCAAHLAQHHAACGHALALDLWDGWLECTPCGQRVDDSLFEAVWRVERAKALRGVQSPAAALAAAQGEQLVAAGRARLVDPGRAAVGLRGMLNLGSTCFASCILQTLLHNPLVAAFFLGDLHSPRTCRRHADAPACLCCSVDALFAHAFAEPGERPAPALRMQELLQALWTHADSLAGYEQQDAHEFLIALLNGLHTDSVRYASLGLGAGHESGCRCVVHRVFSGVLRSELTCNKCAGMSLTLDPFFNLSVDIAPGESGAQGATLAQCLAQLTAPEQLAEQDRVVCQHCGDVQQCTKQFLVQQLPATLCIHIKRFERVGAGLVLGKVQTPVEFPLVLDMAPFVAERTGGPLLYSLVALVQHTGSLETGHYVAFVRVQGDADAGQRGAPVEQWFRLDDAAVTRSDAETVLGTEAYLLFYVAQRLHYETPGLGVAGGGAGGTGEKSGAARTKRTSAGVGGAEGEPKKKRKRKVLAHAPPGTAVPVSSGPAALPPGLQTGGDAADPQDFDFV